MRVVVRRDDSQSEKNKRKKSDVKVDRPHRAVWEVGNFPVILNFSDSEEKTFEGIISSRCEKAAG